MKTTRLIWTVMLLAVLAVGCSKDNPAVVDGNNDRGSAPIFKPKTVSLPVSLENKNDSSAEQTVTYARTINVLFDFSNFYLPVDIPDSMDWEITWTVDGIEVTLVTTENDTGYQWSVTLDGSSSSRGIVYDDFLLLEMEQSRDGTTGGYKIHNLWNNSNDLLAESRWNTLQDGSTFFETTLYKDGRKSKRIEVISQLDHSGELKLFVYRDGTTEQMRFKAEWYVDGSGQCWVYDEMMNEVFHGQW